MAVNYELGEFTWDGWEEFNHLLVLRRKKRVWGDEEQKTVVQQR